MLKKKSRKKILSIVLLLALMLQNTAVVFANTYVTDVRNYIVTSKDGTGIPKTVSYTKDGLSTTLNMKEVQSYRVTKTKQVPVYRTDYKTVSTTQTNTTNSFSNTMAYTTADGYSGTLSKSGSPTTSITTDYKYVTDYRTGSSSSFADTIPYITSDGYSGNIGKSDSAYVISGSPADSFYVTKTYSWFNTDYGQYKGSNYNNDAGWSYNPPSVGYTVGAPGYLEYKDYNGSTVIYGPIQNQNHDATRPYTFIAPDGTIYRTVNEMKVYETIGKESGYYGVLKQQSYVQTTGKNFFRTSSYGLVRGGIYSFATYWVNATYAGYVYRPDTRIWKQNYAGNVSKNITNYIQTYSGTVSKQVLDHYENVPIEWNAQVLYEGYINYPPIANFSMQQYALTNTPVNITNTSTDRDGQIVSSTWSISPSVSNNLGSNGGTLSFSNSGTYAVTLTVKDNDGGTASVTKNITVYKDTEKPVVTLKITPNPVDEDQTITYSGTYTCPTGINSYVYTLTNLVTGKNYVYTNSIPPTNFETAGLPYGNYKVSLKALGKDVDYGNGIIAKGKWSDEVSTDLVVMPSLAINSLKMTNIVNPPLGTTAPINYPVSTPTRIKAGYRMDFNLNVKGGDVVKVKLYANGNELPFYTSDSDRITELTINKKRTEANIPFSLYVDKDTPIDSVLDMKVVLTKKYPDNTQKSIVNTELGWRFAQIVGSTKEDININLIN